MSKIVSEVRQPASCFDVGRCKIRTLTAKPPIEMQDSNSTASVDSSGFEPSVKPAKLSRLTCSMAQIWARMALGEDVPSALDHVFVNTRRGAQKLEKAGADIYSELLCTGHEPTESFDTLKTEIASICADSPALNWGRDAIERVARLLWFSQFQWNLEASLVTCEPLSQTIVDEPTSEYVANMLELIALAVGESGGLTDHRRRGYSPSGTRDISYWEYELCGRNTVWLMSYSRSLSNSRVSAWMVATYFFLLDSGQLARSELGEVDSIGCIDPIAGECMTVKFDDIDEASARNTMERVNGFDDDRITELSRACEPSVRMTIIEARANDARRAGAGKADAGAGSKASSSVVSRGKRAKIGKATTPAETELSAYWEKHGSGSLYSYISAMIRQPRGGVIPLDVFEQVIIGQPVACANAGACSHVVTAMLKFRHSDRGEREEMFARQYRGARVLDSSNTPLADILGVAGLGAVEYLEQLLDEGYGDSGNTDALAATCVKVNAFGIYEGGHMEDRVAHEVSIAERSLDANDIEICRQFYELGISGVEMLGGKITACDFECASAGGVYVESAKLQYVTDGAVIRLSYATSPPKPVAILTDAVARYLGIKNGLLSESTGMAVINPRLGTACVLPMEEYGAVNSVAAEVAAAFGMV